MSMKTDVVSTKYEIIGIKHEVKSINQSLWV